MSNVTHKIFVEKLGGTDATAYIGNPGDLFLDPADGLIRKSDGSNPGEVVVPYIDFKSVYKLLLYPYFTPSKRDKLDAASALLIIK